MIRHFLTALVLTLLFTTSAPAAQCGGDFRTFIGAMSREAAAAGISRAVIDSALSGVSPDQSVLAFDRRQRGTFQMSFERYASTRVTSGRVQRGKQLLQRHAALLSAFSTNSVFRLPCLLQSGASKPISAAAIWASCR